MKRIVVVGGGFAGAYICKKLENAFDVTLIDTKNYFEFTPSILRCLVEPDHLRKIQALHREYLAKTTVLQDTVISIPQLECKKNREVRTNSQTYGYDYLVLCTGSSYSLPIKDREVIAATRAEELTRYHRRLEKSKSVLVIGGGLAGVEMAAELCTVFADKAIILADSHNVLMSRAPKKAQQYAQRFLEKYDVELIFGERVKEHKKGAFICESGRRISADFAILCTGIKPNFDYLKEHKKVLSKRKYVNVKDTLQIKGHPCIFAAGDITAIKEEKTAQNAEEHAKIVVKNIMNLEKGETLQHYESKKRTMVISLGKHNGILIKKKCVWTGLLPGLLKRAIEKKTMWRYRYL
ncbi:hypothetical protein GF342_00420 [Candidatus Woesearchaeota archaeon]|nr:hypothetical protein [Candidatus Woesearchaeota archaeon]